MATNNIKMPPLPTVPVPMNLIAKGLLYMYACSQCDFKTHIEEMFKQHVDSTHLGITTVGSNVIINSNLATLATVAPSNMMGQSQTLVVTPSQLSSMINGGTLPISSVLKSEVEMPTEEFSNVIKQEPGISISEVEESIPKFKCLKCGEILPSRNQLTLHNRRVHGKQAQQTTQAGTYQVQLNPAPAHQSSIVHVQTQSSSSVLSNAAPTAHQSQTQVIVTGGRQTDGDSHVTVVTTPPSSGGAKKSYTCTSCGYTTSRRDGLSQHYDSVHLKIKNHKCDLCPYAASQKGTLNRHVKLRHRKRQDQNTGNSSDDSALP